MQDDESFLTQLREGVPAAYAVLVERYEQPLYRFFYCDHRNHHTAQEQTAETFTQLVRSLRRMRGGCDKLRAFIFATARHVQLRRIRDRNIRPVSLAEAFDVSDRRPSPQVVASNREQLQRVLAAISRLDDSIRNVLLLRFVEGCSIEEVAEVLDLPVGTVKSHIHRSRTQLRQLFAQQEFDS